MFGITVKVMPEVVARIRMVQVHLSSNSNSVKKTRRVYRFIKSSQRSPASVSRDTTVFLSDNIIRTIERWSCHQTRDESTLFSVRQDISSQRTVLLRPAYYEMEPNQNEYLDALTSVVHRSLRTRQLCRGRSPGPIELFCELCRGKPAVRDAYS